MARELWDVLRHRGRRVWTGGPNGVAVVAHSADVVELLRTRMVSKTGLAEIAQEQLHGARWARTVACSTPLLHDDEAHRRLRSALEVCWPHIPLEAIGPALEERLTGPRAAELDPDELAARVVDVVLRLLGGTNIPPDVVHDIVSLAPALNRMFLLSRGEVGLADRLDGVCDRLAIWVSSPESVQSVASSLAEVLPFETAVALLLFLLIAAVETTHTLTMLAIRASEAPPDSRGSAWDLFADVPPLPYVYYVAGKEASLGTESIKAGSRVGLCLAQEPHSSMRLMFGVGPHHCFGARIALAVGSHLLRVLPEQPVRRWSWERDRLTWRLTPNEVGSGHG